MSAVPIPRDALPDDWVPVEHRWLGLDKRTIAPGLVAIAVIIFFSGVIPAVDQAIEYDRQIEAGDVVDLGSGVTFVPAVGWGFPNGLLVSQETVGGTEAATNLGATLENGAVVPTVTTGPFAGTPDELLDRIEDLNQTYQGIDNSKATTERVTATTTDGTTGVAEGFLGVDIEGVNAAFVIDGIGVEFVVSGPTDTVATNSDEIEAMIDSLTTSDPEA